MKKAFTLIEALVALVALAILSLLILGGVDLAISISDEPVEKIVTKLNYEPSYTTLESSYDHSTGRTELTTTVHPEEYTIICGYGEPVTLQTTEEKWKEVKVNDKVIVYFRKGGITKIKYVSGWILSRHTAPESNNP